MRMGLNAYFTYSVCLGNGVPWQTALAAVLFQELYFGNQLSLRFELAIVNAIPCR